MASYTRARQGDARVMDRLDRQLRQACCDMPSRRWIKAGIEFLREGLARGCLDHLNELGEMIGPESTLSERSIDTLFESGAASDLFLAALREEAAKDRYFDERLRAHFGDRTLDRMLRDQTTLQTADLMAEMDHQLRTASRDLASRRWIDAGIAFLEHALSRNCLDRLDELGRIAGGASKLGSSSLDLLFQSGDATERFRLALREVASRNPTFGDQLRACLGADVLDRPLQLAQPDLFACAA